LNKFNAGNFWETSQFVIYLNLAKARCVKLLTLAGKVAILLSTSVLLKMAERSEAKSVERSFPSKIKI